MANWRKKVADHGAYLKKLSLDELDKLINQAEAMKEKKAEDNRAEVLKQMEDIAKKSGLTLDQVLGGSVGKGGTSRKKPEKKIRYRNPEDHSETWTGLGQRPKWLRKKIDAGASKEDFLIPGK